MKTAVRWLAEAVSKLGYVSTDILEQAKEMEKQQIIDAYSKGLVNGGMEYKNFNNGLHYFFETYGSKGSDETKTDKI